jgi:hypothetical protein
MPLGYLTKKFRDDNDCYYPEGLVVGVLRKASHAPSVRAAYDLESDK